MAAGRKPSKILTSAARRDVQRRVRGALKIASRKLILDQNRLSAKNFF
jgi:hypothetical protein